jgi:hypothetical protein
VHVLCSKMYLRTDVLLVSKLLCFRYKSCATLRYQITSDNQITASRVQDGLPPHVKQQIIDAKGKKAEQTIIDNLLVRRGTHFEVLASYF